jgi:hypothetical protein
MRAIQSINAPRHSHRKGQMAADWRRLVEWDKAQKALQIRR